MRCKIEYEFEFDLGKGETEYLSCICRGREYMNLQRLR